jgi:hypothetical protein
MAYIERVQGVLEREVQILRLGSVLGGLIGQRRHQGLGLRELRLHQLLGGMIDL